MKICLLLVLFFLGFTALSLAEDNTLVDSTPLDTENIDAHIAGMSDVQVRQAYTEKLKEEAGRQATSVQPLTPNTPTDPLGIKIHNAARGTSAVLAQVGGIFSGAGAKQGAPQWNDIVLKLSDNKGGSGLFLTFLGVIAIIIAGLLLQRLFVRSTSELQEKLLQQGQLGRFFFLSRLFSRMLLDALGVGVYVLTTFVIFVLAYSGGSASHVIAFVSIVISYYIMAFAFVARIVFSPDTSAMRLFPMENQTALFLYSWILRIVFIVGVFAGFSNITRRLDIGGSLHQAMFAAEGAVVILAVIIMIFQSREQVRKAIRAEETDSAPDGHPLREFFANTWHYFALICVLMAGSVWLVKALNGDDVTVLSLIGSIFLVPIVIGVDQWVQRLLSIASGESRETIDLSGDESSKSDTPQDIEDEKDLTHYIPMIRRLFRLFLLAFLFFITLRMWSIDLSIGRVFTSRALSILIIVLFAFIIWQVVKSRIDQKLKEEMPDDEEEAEEGGAGGSRMGTLLVLLRKFVLTVIFVIVSLVVLSSLGVNIGPLIAGAGVIGLAIGFGAQTLVKDIIAGVFFLIDDAFRVGDFIEVGGTKGMVEHISLRSLRLRNPKGPVHTIPFGTMGTVTNMSRDYIITKLDFRVRYDTNVDKVRKIIKKINKTIAKDPEMGPNLLDKIKSQGVRELDDSAMIMRVKFKTVPGEQFVVRREVYRMMQESFKENGIEFAHRNVTVYLPPEDQEKKPDINAIEAAAAAAALSESQKKESKE